MEYEPRWFALSPAGIDRLIWNRGVRGAIIFVLLIAGLVLYVGQPLDPDHRLRAAFTGIFIILLSVPLILIVSRRNRRVLSTYRLMVSEDAVLRTQSDLNPMRLARNEVLKIEESPGVALFLKTGNRYRRLRIPAYLDGYDDARAMLASWCSPEVLTRAKRTLQWTGKSVPALLTLSVWVLCALTQRLITLGAEGILFYGLLIWISYDYVRRPNIPGHLKWLTAAAAALSWRIVLFPLLRFLTILNR